MNTTVIAAQPTTKPQAGERCPRCGGSDTKKRKDRTLWCANCQQVTWTYGVYPDDTQQVVTPISPSVYIALSMLEDIKERLTGDTLAEIGYYDVEPFIVQAISRHDKLVAALKSVIANHCSNDKFFCGSCSPAREVLAAIEREGETGVG